MANSPSSGGWNRVSRGAPMLQSKVQTKGTYRASHVIQFVSIAGARLCNEKVSLLACWLPLCGSQRIFPIARRAEISPKRDLSTPKQSDIHLATKTVLEIAATIAISCSTTNFFPLFLH
jgi:hypothetical protein